MYNPNCNPIKKFFSQLKNYVKNKIKEEHLQNYFKYLFIQAYDYINKNNCPKFQ